MPEPGRVALHTLPDSRTLEYWEGGDPDGRAVLVHDGTPTTYALAVLQHELALERGIRLISVNRPGYGRSSPAPVSLAGTGRDTAHLAKELGLGTYAVVGVSGGGPFACATAIADPDRVRVVGILDAVGPWVQLDEPADHDAAERAILTSLGRDDVEAARPAMLAVAEADLGALRDLDDDALVDQFLGGFSSPLTADTEFRAAWARTFRLIFNGPYGLDGYVADNLAWGGPWDIDPSDVAARTLLWFTEEAPGRVNNYGRWYADRMATSSLTVVPGADHLDLCGGRWPETFDDLMGVWDSED